MARQPRDPPATPRHFASQEDIDRAVTKLERRLAQLEALDVEAAEKGETGEIAVVESALRETIRDVFGGNSPEFREHEHIRIWGGSMGVNMSTPAVLAARRRGKIEVATVVRGLIDRLHERREDLPRPVAPTAPSDPIANAWTLLHPRVQVVAKDRFASGHYADAVEASLKELATTVRALLIKRGGPELDGTALMQTAFSAKNPVIVLADLGTQSGRDMQRGFMDLFSGAMSAIRNPKAHGNVEITRERAFHFLFLASMLWHTLDDRP